MIAHMPRPRVCRFGAHFTGKPGTVVVDLTDPNHSQEAGFIDTPGLSAPGEGIRTHAGRGLLVAAYYNNTPDVMMEIVRMLRPLPAGHPDQRTLPGVGLAQRAGIKAACGLQRTPFGMVRIFDVGDEHKPILVKNLVLEVNDPKNCALIGPEISALRPAGDAGGGSLFLYGAHMCTVDNRDNATTLACSYFNAGIRVYDIRDPKNAKEIAYYTPPAKTAGSIGWCPALPFLDSCSTATALG
jgi:hypothetical protein